MQVRETAIEGLIELIPRVFEDERGYFFESYNKPLFTSLGLLEEFVQDNQSFSAKGVLRGLHMQNEPFAQGKLVRVITGQVLDVAVDLRVDSPTFGQYETFLLNAKLANMAYIQRALVMVSLRSKTAFSVINALIFIIKRPKQASDGMTLTSTSTGESVTQLSRRKTRS
jgi:dTDP-4-dehydrorhamnose 3,5-epimerase